MKNIIVFRRNIRKEEEIVFPIFASFFIKKAEIYVREYFPMNMCTKCQTIYLEKRMSFAVLNAQKGHL